MAKSVRSKVKKRNRSYMRATIGEKVRTANIEAAAGRLAAKQQGRGEDSRTLVAMKGALQRVDLGKAYYEAVVRPSRETVPAPPQPEPMEDDDKEDDEKPAADRAEEVIKTYTVLSKRRGLRNAKLGGTGIFSGGRRRRAARSSSRPPKPVAKF
ncbi:hypothetical protein CTAYLR_001216 [Chrysophaeum taylorii]|uniref:DUF2423 domain-containing protein n=1 Tax=Chrysophaeum taylorii TaxID=2483200 RepID=A0AAD7UCK6_9STRA|nr:hypothetical protein CTAYLR_001216 [Chrysophaeum taylorii]